MKSAIVAALIGSAAAFAPAPAAKTTTAINGAFDNEIGAASAELGCWDPLGFVTDQERFNHLRGVELKHGRIAMLATWGYATTWSGARFPGCEDFAAGHGENSPDFCVVCHKKAFSFNSLHFVSFYTL